METNIDIYTHQADSSDLPGDPVHRNRIAYLTGMGEDLLEISRSYNTRRNKIR